MDWDKLDQFVAHSATVVMVLTVLYFGTRMLEWYWR